MEDSVPFEGRALSSNHPAIRFRWGSHVQTGKLTSCPHCYLSQGGCAFKRQGHRGPQAHQGLRPKGLFIWFSGGLACLSRSILIL